MCVRTLHLPIITGVVASVTVNTRYCLACPASKSPCADWPRGMLKRAVRWPDMYAVFSFLSSFFLKVHELKDQFFLGGGVSLDFISIP